MAINIREPKTSFPYLSSQSCTMIFNDQTRDFMRFIKESYPVELDYLTKIDGELLPEDLYTILHQFGEQYCIDYLGPVLFFSQTAINRKLKLLQQLAQTYNVHFLMAVKAMPKSPIYMAANHYLSGFDVSNLAEYNILPESLAEKIIFITAPVFPKQLNNFLSKGNRICITIDSLSQYEQLLELKQPTDFCIRLDASILLKEYFKTFSEANYYSHFGVSPNNICELQSMINTENSTFKGFHIHCGYGEGNTPHCYLEITKQVLKLAEQLNVELQYFNLGGGICYLSEYELTTLIKQIRAMIPIQTQLFFEPGRFISKNSGFALAKIESVISRDTSIDIILDLSEQCHLRWSDATLVIPTEIIDSEALNVRVFGPTCAEIDAIGNFTLSIEQRKLLQRGNKILLGGITGYSASWNTSFNGIPIAKVVYGV